MSYPLLQPHITCASGDAEIEHCHGTALVRDDGPHACSDDPDCAFEIDQHWFVARDEV